MRFYASRRRYRSGGKDACKKTHFAASDGKNGDQECQVLCQWLRQKEKQKDKSTDEREECTLARRLESIKHFLCHGNTVEALEELHEFTEDWDTIVRKWYPGFRPVETSSTEMPLAACCPDFSVISRLS